MMTAPAAALQEIYAAARERLEARRNVYRSYTDTEELRARLEGRTLPRVPLDAPDFRGPETVSEFFDSRLIERRQFFGCPEVPLLYEVAEAARQDAAAAVRALKAARKLDPRTQWVIHQAITEWRRCEGADKTGAERTVSALLAEWSRLRLAEEDPDAE